MHLFFQTTWKFQIQTRNQQNQNYQQNYHQNYQQNYQQNPNYGYAPNQGQPQNPNYGYAPVQPPVADPGKGMAIAAMVLGIISFFCFPAITGALGIIFGCVAKGKGSRSGMAIAGIICGAIGIAVGDIVGVADDVRKSG